MCSSLCLCDLSLSSCACTCCIGLHLWLVDIKFPLQPQTQVIEVILCLHTLMDTISRTQLSRNTLLFPTFPSAQIFRLDVQFSAKEKYTKSLFMPNCLLCHVGFVAVLLVCALLIKFPVEEFIVFVKQKRENLKSRAKQSLCVIEVFLSIVLGLLFACYIPGLPGRSRTLAGLPHAHCVERPFVSMLGAVLPPARPLCRFTASHYHSAM